MPPNFSINIYLLIPTVEEVSYEEEPALITELYKSVFVVGMVVLLLLLLFVMKKKQWLKRETFKT